MSQDLFYSEGGLLSVTVGKTLHTHCSGLLGYRDQKVEKIFELIELHLGDGLEIAALLVLTLLGDKMAAVLVSWDRALQSARVILGRWH